MEKRFETATLIVEQKHEGGDILITSKREKAIIRVGASQGGIAVTAHDGVIFPYSVNGLPAFIVQERDKSS